MRYAIPYAITVEIVESKPTKVYHWIIRGCIIACSAMLKTYEYISRHATRHASRHAARHATIHVPGTFQVLVYNLYPSFTSTSVRNVSIPR